MKHFNIIALAALAFSLSTSAGALEPAKPGGCDGGGGGGLADFGGGCGGGAPGPGDPSLDPSKMPRGGDEYNQKLVDRKEKEAERKEAERKEAEKRKREAEQASQMKYKTLGRVNPSSVSTQTPPHTICEAARDARARNSPAAPDLEAQCRARH